MLGLIDGDVLLHSSLWKTTSLEQAKKNIDYNIMDWTLGAFCDESVIAIGELDGHNYRDDLFPMYKKSVSRVSGRKKRLGHLTDAKKYIASLPNCIVADYIEADDLIGHWATETRGDSVVISVDKDLRQMEGVFFNPHKREGNQYRDEYRVVSLEEANLFFLEQMLSGDSMDNIPGLPGVATIKAKKKLEQAEDKPRMVVDEYRQAYGDEWKDYFLANGKLLFIQREPGQHFTLSLFERMFDIGIA